MTLKEQVSCLAKHCIQAIGGLYSLEKRVEKIEKQLKSKRKRGKRK